MYRRSCSFTQSSMVFLLVGVLASLVGCNQDPAVTVTVEISGISAESDREDVKESLEGMTDGSSYSTNSSHSGSKMTISLSPVSDVDAFVKKINFGTVTEVKGRTVKVDFAP